MLMELKKYESSFTDKMDIDRWVPDDQRITIYGLCYSFAPSTR